MIIYASHSEASIISTMWILFHGSISSSATQHFDCFISIRQPFFLASPLLTNWNRKNANFFSLHGFAFFHALAVGVGWEGAEKKAFEVEEEIFPLGVAESFLNPIYPISTVMNCCFPSVVAFAKRFNARVNICAWKKIFRSLNISSSFAEFDSEAKGKVK